jgi:flavin-dependent dehydrogenase
MLLARAGRPVTLLERAATPTHKVCGDFLSAEAIEAIAALGIDLASLAPARITALRLVHGRQTAETSLPFPALGLSRHALDAALLDGAAASGAMVLRGHSVRRIQHGRQTAMIDVGAMGQFGAESVFLATGKHDLHGAPRPGRATGPIGLKTYYVLAPSQLAALRGYIDLVLFNGGYAGLQLVEADKAVLCLLVARDRLRHCGGWDALLDALQAECPHLALRLSGATPALSRPVAIAGLPYGHLHGPCAADPPRLFRLGDQAAVIPSLTGDGVSLALASAALAIRTCLQSDNDAALYHRRLRRLALRQMQRATALHRLCLSSGMQPWVLRAARAWPGAMRLAATWTRLPAALRTRSCEHSPAVE